MASQSSPLIAEVEHMKTSLHAAVAASAELFGFQVDAQKAGRSRFTIHTGKPTAALSHSIEQYNQAYDSLEAHLVRALAVLEANLAYERERAEERAREAEQTHLVASPEPLMPPPSHHLSPNIIAQASVSGLAARRPSAIALSSLSHRAPPLRLDLSAVTLPLSPVTLAPRTSVPRTSVAAEFPVGTDFLGQTPVFGQPAQVQSQIIDLTAQAQAQAQSQMMDLSAQTQTQSQIIDLTMTDAPQQAAGGVGTSDQPIEIDLDSPIEELFGPSPDATQAATQQQQDQDDALNADLFGDAASTAAADTALLDALNVAGVDFENLGASLPAAGQADLSAVQPDSLEGITGLDANIFQNMDMQSMQIDDIMNIDFTQIPGFGTAAAGTDGTAPSTEQPSIT
ncbi:hypothetical protein BKA62DRAFT_776881 [Auriculariales sp. MPI-PUGE-AT-0066]|nr:hypothetical protein BKA62DRAFT_776881 [Auriculariales sp. MPI-PUGE-AT-0066]